MNKLVPMLTDVVVTGLLKGYDQLMNLVLDNVKEITRGEPICDCHCPLRHHAELL